MIPRNKDGSYRMWVLFYEGGPRKDGSMYMHPYTAGSSASLAWSRFKQLNPKAHFDCGNFKARQVTFTVKQPKPKKKRK